MTQFCLSRGTKSLLDNEFLFGMNTVATPLLIGIKNRSLSMDPGVQMACDDEASSGSGDDGHMLDGNSSVILSDHQILVVEREVERLLAML